MWLVNLRRIFGSDLMMVEDRATVCVLVLLLERRRLPRIEEDALFLNNKCVPKTWCRPDFSVKPSPTLPHTGEKL